MPIEQDTFIVGQALRFFEKLREQPDYNIPELWRRLAACQQALGNNEGATDIYCNILESAPAVAACPLISLQFCITSHLCWCFLVAA